jgi:hypothetical protein
MFRFSIRELGLLTLVVGLALGWWLEHRASAANAAAADDAKFLAQVATHGCNCQLVDQFLDLQRKYGVAPVFDTARWQALTEQHRQTGTLNAQAESR